jgi:hypothetical protein
LRENIFFDERKMVLRARTNRSKNQSFTQLKINAVMLNIYIYIYIYNKTNNKHALSNVVVT